MTWRVCLFAIFIPFNLPAAVYKCEIKGVTTYSQTPCAIDAKEIAVRTNGNSSSDGLSEHDLQQACLNVIKRKNTWKDITSVRIEGATKSWSNDDSGPRHILTLHINAKNGYGGYGGAEPFICFLNSSGTGLSQIQQFVFMPKK